MLNKTNDKNSHYFGNHIHAVILAEFPPNATASLVASILEATDVSLGKLKVARSDTCHGFKYKIEWVTVPGKQEMFEVSVLII